jgi:hypothetical protein
MGHSFPKDDANDYKDVWDLMLAKAIRQLELPLLSGSIDSDRSSASSTNHSRHARSASDHE